MTTQLILSKTPIEEQMRNKNGKTNATYESTDQRRTAAEEPPWSVEKHTGCSKLLYSPFIGIDRLSLGTSQSELFVRPSEKLGTNLQGNLCT